MNMTSTMRVTTARAEEEHKPRQTQKSQMHPKCLSERARSVML